MVNSNKKMKLRNSSHVDLQKVEILIDAELLRDSEVTKDNESKMNPFILPVEIDRRHADS